MERLVRSLESEGGLTCSCGRSFPLQSALTKHQKSCQKSKKRLSRALDKAKSMWSGRKRRRLDPSDERTGPGVTVPLVGTRPLSASLILGASHADQEMADYEVCPNRLHN
jgi:hypothetical protein